jgi:AcrR family transcriptional regulator
MTQARDRILGCACDLYLRDGFEGFSMRKLARAVGVSPSALYRHFEGKEDLLLDVVGEAYKVMAQYLHQALGGQDAQERFRLAGEGYLTFALEHPRYYEILYSYAQFLGMDEVPRQLEPLVSGIHQFWLDRVRECMDAGILRQDDPEVVARTFWALSHGFISIHQRKMLCMDDDAFKEAFNAAAGHLMAGVAGNPAAISS